MKQRFSPSVLKEICVEGLLNGIGYEDEFPYTTAYDFLMGSCHLFALALSREFGYKICEVRKSQDKGLIHSFCIVKSSLQTFFVDVRGVYTDFKEFISYFSGFITVDDIFTLVAPDEIKLEDKWDSVGIQFAEAIIKRYREYYII